MELLTVFKSLKKLHDLGHPDEALSVIEDIIERAEGNRKVKADPPMNLDPAQK